MALTAGSAVFIDTNILIYASFPSAPFHQAAVSRLSKFEGDGVVFWKSRQVLREYLAAVTGCLLRLLNSRVIKADRSTTRILSLR